MAFRRAVLCEIALRHEGQVWLQLIHQGRSTEPVYSFGKLPKPAHINDIGSDVVRGALRDLLAPNHEHLKSCEAGVLQARPWRYLYAYGTQSLFELQNDGLHLFKCAESTGGQAGVLASNRVCHVFTVLQRVSPRWTR